MSYAAQLRDRRNHAPAEAILAKPPRGTLAARFPRVSRYFRRLTTLSTKSPIAHFSYFVWGQNVVIVDGQTNVVSAIFPDVVAHQD